MGQPLYLMIKDDLKMKIESKDYITGDKLPSEARLCEIYNAGKSTIRHALNILEDMGYIYAVNRIGYFVSELKNDQYVIKFDEFNIGDERITDIKVLYAIIVNNDDLKRHKRGFPENSKAIKVARIFNYLNIPVCYEEKFLMYTKEFPIKSEDLFGGNSADLVNDYIMTYSLKRNITIKTITAGHDICKFLLVDAEAAVLRVEQIFLDRYDRPLGYCYNYYNCNYASIKAKTYDKYTSK
ncbi:MAG: GntR family transcriptional regulator [Eubacteriales bacterium]